MNHKAAKELPNFVELRRRFDTLEPGRKAELRRVAAPEDLSLVTAFYRVFPGVKPDDRHRRVAFLLPWCAQAKGEFGDFGCQLVDKDINEMRVLQVARASSPLDLIQLRRITMHVEPIVDWSRFGPMLWYWGTGNKRLLVENFYLAKFSMAKGGRK